MRSFIPVAIHLLDQRTLITFLLIICAILTKLVRIAQKMSGEKKQITEKGIQEKFHTFSVGFSMAVPPFFQLNHTRPRIVVLKINRTLTRTITII